jgi:hypothetical protein
MPCSWDSQYNVGRRGRAVELAIAGVILGVQGCQACARAFIFVVLRTQKRTPSSPRVPSRAAVVLAMEVCGVLACMFAFVNSVFYFEKIENEKLAFRQFYTSIEAAFFCLSQIFYYAWMLLRGKVLQAPKFRPNACERLTGPVLLAIQALLALVIYVMYHTALTASMTVFLVLYYTFAFLEVPLTVAVTWILVKPFWSVYKISSKNKVLWDVVWRTVSGASIYMVLWVSFQLMAVAYNAAWIGPPCKGVALGHSILHNVLRLGLQVSVSLSHRDDVLVVRFARRFAERCCGSDKGSRDNAAANLPRATEGGAEDTNRPTRRLSLFPLLMRLIVKIEEEEEEAVAHSPSESSAAAEHGETELFSGHDNDILAKHKTEQENPITEAADLP